MLSTTSSPSPYQCSSLAICSVDGDEADIQRVGGELRINGELLTAYDSVEVESVPASAAVAETRRVQLQQHQSAARKGNPMLLVGMMLGLAVVAGSKECLKALRNK